MELLKLRKNSKYNNIIKEIYENSFPKSEQIPFNDIVNSKLPNAKLIAIIQHDIVLGFFFVFNAKDIVYLHYFAVEERNRNKGIGSNSLNMLKNIYKNQTFIVSIEEPITNFSKRRINFYKRNGFESVGYKYNWQGVDLIPMKRGNENAENCLKFIKQYISYSNDFRKL